MIIDLGTEILHVNGKVKKELVGSEVIDGRRKGGKMVPITVRSVITGALNSVLEADQNRSLTSHDKAYNLLVKIHKEPVIELDSEEISMIKNRLAKMPFGSVTITQVARILEGKDIGIDAVEKDEDSDDNTIKFTDQD